MMDQPTSPRHDLRVSLALVSAVVVFALIGLATDHNWPKLLRVSLAFATYAGSLLAFTNARRADASAEALIEYRWFAIAGALAGLVSGIVRPEFRLDVLVAGTGAASVLLAGVHWLALRYWRRLLPHALEQS
jgi:hypothetical protein